eukprot:2625731-Pleurochrysis_carterae.AAC.1
MCSCCGSVGNGSSGGIDSAGIRGVRQHRLRGATLAPDAMAKARGGCAEANGEDVANGGKVASDARCLRGLDRAHLSISVCQVKAAGGRLERKDRDWGSPFIRLLASAFAPAKG